ncbi:unnamed protein product [Darwinula stevensoni]|uniref:C2H2-type domain-containing protein n=1 Tax=Darwinula stevensoni TaxID=69355 RepID=A0A7R8X5B8_9CRUS|nr:unnamed protein product [Darwinula stevensoni]CAG0880266.1 unnamed protein product [Darwinula stevensoni]
MPKAGPAHESTDRIQRVVRSIDSASTRPPTDFIEVQPAHPYLEFSGNNIFFCKLCKVPCTGQKGWDSHVVGYSHFKNIDKETMKGPNVFGCHMCNLTCTGWQAFESHVRGRKHQRNLAMHTEKRIPVPPPDLPPDYVPPDDVLQGLGFAIVQDHGARSCSRSSSSSCTRIASGAGSSCQQDPHQEEAGWKSDPKGASQGSSDVKPDRKDFVGKSSSCQQESGAEGDRFGPLAKAKAQEDGGESRNRTKRPQGIYQPPHVRAGWSLKEERDQRPVPQSHSIPSVKPEKDLRGGSSQPRLPQPKMEVGAAFRGGSEQKPNGGWYLRNDGSDPVAMPYGASKFPGRNSEERTSAMGNPSQENVRPSNASDKASQGIGHSASLQASGELDLTKKLVEIVTKLAKDAPNGIVERKGKVSSIRDLSQHLTDVPPESPESGRPRLLVFMLHPAGYQLMPSNHTSLKTKDSRMQQGSLT